MQIRSAMTNLAVKAMSESLNVDVMTVIAEKLMHNYDLYQRTGYPSNIPIQKIDAAKQIVKDIKQQDLFLDLINLLILFHTEGHMGRKYQIQHLKAIIRDVQEAGMIYDQINRTFVENSDFKKTRNWGVLREGQEYIQAFLRLDIVGNTKLVKKYPEDIIQATYADLRDIVKRSIDAREGRIWNWEGDGGLVAFYYGNKNLSAVTSGMEIVHDIFIYNQVACRLDNPLGVRIAVHSGLCEYTANEEDLKKRDVIKKLVDIEAKYTNPNSLSISSVVRNSLDKQLSSHFVPVNGGKGNDIFNYQLRWVQ